MTSNTAGLRGFGVNGTRRPIIVWGMKGGAYDMPPIPLSKRRSGINAFRVEGRVYTGPVRARWNGQSLLVSRTLWDHAMLAVAVEEAFAEAGVSWPCGLLDRWSPEFLLLTLVTCCDEIDIVEYERDGYRRVISGAS